jgi:uncharacterized metal-binding protein YceD (DUF177 family)
MTGAPAPEFSRRISLSRIGAQPFRQEIVASESERDALARRLDLVSLDRLTAQIELTPRGRDMYLLRAEFSASFAQNCVVTLEPVPDAVSEQFELLYGPPESEEAAEGIAGDEVAFEPLSGEAIDVGEAVAQEFSLALPEFPRAPDADLAAEMPAGEADGHPFALLSRLRKPDEAGR